MLNKEKRENYEKNSEYSFIKGNIELDEQKLDQLLHLEENFDLLKREFDIGDKRAVIYYINGFCKDDMLQKIQEFFLGIDVSDVESSVIDFANNQIPYLEINLYGDKYNVVTMLLSGVSCLLIDGFNKAILIDAREYPARNVQEPEKYKVLRGSRDGFVETLILNTALIRRRIRNPEYICKVMRAGKSSRTDIAICYMNDRVDRKLLDRIISNIEKIDVDAITVARWETGKMDTNENNIEKIYTDALTMNQESLSEAVYKGKWFNPFPKFRYTERPDTVAASVLEGQIAILVDNSPAAMLLPTTIFDVIEEADDYYFPPVTGTYLRLARMIVTVMSLLLTPLFLLYANNPEILPDWLMFTKIEQPEYVPIFWQLLILELAVDGLKLAAINTPSTLNTPLSLIAAIVIGEFSVNTGWFNQQTMLYMAVVAIANFTHENYELAYSVKFLRIIMLIFTQIFGLYGFIGGIIFTLAVVGLNKTIAGTSYVYPLMPLDFKVFLQRFYRVSLKAKNKK